MLLMGAEHAASVCNTPEGVDDDSARDASASVDVSVFLSRAAREASVQPAADSMALSRATASSSASLRGRRKNGVEMRGGAADAPV
jgi:hypothetical protein